MSHKGRVPCPTLRPSQSQSSTKSRTGPHLVRIVTHPLYFYHCPLFFRPLGERKKQREEKVKWGIVCVRHPLHTGLFLKFVVPTWVLCHNKSRCLYLSTLLEVTGILSSLLYELSFDYHLTYLWECLLLVFVHFDSTFFRSS